MNIATKYNLGDVVPIHCYEKDGEFGDKPIIAQARVIGIHASILPKCKTLYWYEKNENNQTISVKYDLEPLNEKLFCNSPQYEKTIEAITDDAPLI